jgi:hypothetical protein
MKRRIEGVRRTPVEAGRHDEHEDSRPYPLTQHRFLRLFQIVNMNKLTNILHSMHKVFKPRPFKTRIWLKFYRKTDGYIYISGSGNGKNRPVEWQADRQKSLLAGGVEDAIPHFQSNLTTCATDWIEKCRF